MPPDLTQLSSTLRTSLRLRPATAYFRYDYGTAVVRRGCLLSVD